MSKPRTFLSSTCFDFADARAAVAEHLKTLGHEPIRSDTPEFGVSLGKHSHEACLDQVDNCDYFVLLIGGRRGGTFVGSEQSITNEEYRRALKKRKPIITFVKRDVELARAVYKKNPKADFSGVVDDVRIFDFIDLVTSQSENNWIKVFDNVEDIKRALTDQFAYIALEYSKALVASRDPKSGTKDKAEIVRFPAQLAVISDSDNSAEAAMKITGLRGLHKLLSGIIKSPASGKDEKLKLLWVMGRYGQMKYGPPIYISNDRLKQYAWSIGKGKRVFEQIRDVLHHLRLVRDTRSRHRRTLEREEMDRPNHDLVGNRYDSDWLCALCRTVLCGPLLFGGCRIQLFPRHDGLLDTLVLRTRPQPSHRLLICS